MLQAGAQENLMLQVSSPPGLVGKEPFAAKKTAKDHAHLTKAKRAKKMVKDHAHPTTAKRAKDEAADATAKEEPHAAAAELEREGASDATEPAQAGTCLAEDAACGPPTKTRTDAAQCAGAKQCCGNLVCMYNMHYTDEFNNAATCGDLELIDDGTGHTPGYGVCGDAHLAPRTAAPTAAPATTAAPDDACPDIHRQFDEWCKELDPPRPGSKWCKSHPLSGYPDSCPTGSLFDTCNDFWNRCQLPAPPRAGGDSIDSSPVCDCCTVQPAT